MAIVDALQLEAAPVPRQSFAAFITTPDAICQVWSRLISIAVLQRFCCVYILCSVTLYFDPVTLTFDSLTLNIYSVSPVTGWNSVPTKFERNRAIRGGVHAISVFDLMTLNMCYVLRSAVG